MFLPFFLPSAPDLRFELIYRTSVKIILFHEIKNILCKKNVSLKKAHGSKLSRSSVENFKHNSELKKLTFRFITLVQGYSTRIQFTISFQKKKLEMKKLEKVLKPEEYAATLSSLGAHETQARLASQYAALEQEYRRVLHRMEQD